MRKTNLSLEKCLLLIKIYITTKTMKQNDIKEEERLMRVMMPWAFAEDKNNLWREYTLEECGVKPIKVSEL